MNALRAEAAIGRRHTLLVLYRGASDVAARGAMSVVTIVAARQLTRDDFGLFALASTLGWLGAVAADFGIQAHLARTVSQHPSGKDLLRRWLPVRIVTGLGALLLAWIASIVLGVPHQVTWPMLYFMLADAAGGPTDSLCYFFRGLDWTDLESTFTLVQRGSMFVLAVGALWWRPNVALLGQAMLVPALQPSQWPVHCAWRLASGMEASDRWTAGPLGREFLHGVAPIGIGILLSALYFRIDVFLLERWSGTTAVALYNAVFRVVDALRLFPAAVLAVALPVLCRAGDLKPLVRLAAPLTAAACGVAVVLWLTAGVGRAGPLRRAYAEAVPPFRTLVLALPLMALNYALTQQVIGWHGQRAYAAVCAGALGFNLLLNWQLIPALGMTGAAWSTLWTEVFMTVGCGISLARLDNAPMALAVSSAAAAPLEDTRMTPMPLRYATVGEAGLTPQEEAIARSVNWTPPSSTTRCTLAAAADAHRVDPDSQRDCRDRAPQCRALAGDGRTRRLFLSRGTIGPHRHPAAPGSAKPRVPRRTRAAAAAHCGAPICPDGGALRQHCAPEPRIGRRPRPVSRDTGRAGMEHRGDGRRAREALGRRATLCANFVVSETALAFDQQDLFTASQVINLRPIVGNDTYRRIVRSNAFVQDFYPNFHASSTSSFRVRQSRIVQAAKAVAEFVLFVPSLLAEQVCRSAYRADLRRRSATWESPSRSCSATAC